MNNTDNAVTLDVVSLSTSALSLEQMRAANPTRCRVLCGSRRRRRRRQIRLGGGNERDKSRRRVICCLLPPSLWWRRESCDRRRRNSKLYEEAARTTRLSERYIADMTQSSTQSGNVRLCRLQEALLKINSLTFNYILK